MLNLLNFKQRNIAFDLIFLYFVKFPFVKYLLDIHLTYINSNPCAGPCAVAAIRSAEFSYLSRSSGFASKAHFPGCQCPSRAGMRSRVHSSRHRTLPGGAFGPAPHWPGWAPLGTCATVQDFLPSPPASLSPAGVRPTLWSESSPCLLLPFPVLSHN